MPKRKPNHKQSPANHNQIRPRKERANIIESQSATISQQRITPTIPGYRIKAAWDYFSRALVAPNFLGKAWNYLVKIILAVQSCRERAWKYIRRTIPPAHSFLLRAWNVISRLG